MLAEQTYIQVPYLVVCQVILAQARDHLSATDYSVYVDATVAQLIMSLVIQFVENLTFNCKQFARIFSYANITPKVVYQTQTIGNTSLR